MKAMKIVEVTTRNSDYDRNILIKAIIEFERIDYNFEEVLL